MSPQNSRFADLVRALKGGPNESVVRELLHELRLERSFRKRIQRLRKSQSACLFRTAAELSLLKHEVGR